MKYIITAIADINIIEPEVFTDYKGYSVETFR